MANEKIEVDLEGLTTQAEKLSEVVDEYKNFGENPFDKDIEELEKMNSDFIAKLKVMIENMDSNNKKMIKALESVVKNTNKIVSNFQDVDENSKQSMKGE